MNKRSVFWFKRDLRVEDNTGLYHAVSESKEVIPVKTGIQLFKR